MNLDPNVVMAELDAQALRRVRRRPLGLRGWLWHFLGHPIKFAPNNKDYCRECDFSYPLGRKTPLK